MKRNEVKCSAVKGVTLVCCCGYIWVVKGKELKVTLKLCTITMEKQFQELQYTLQLLFFFPISIVDIFGWSCVYCVIVLCVFFLHHYCLVCILFTSLLSCVYCCNLIIVLCVLLLPHVYCCIVCVLFSYISY